MSNTDYLIIALGILPSFAWLIFYLNEDPHPEPKSLIFETFLAGGVSTIIVLFVERLFGAGINAFGIGVYSLVSLFGLAIIEESFKFLAAHFVVAGHRSDFDEPVDGMIYLIIAALGFATIENISAAIKSPDLALETTTLRFIGATLLHTLSSGLIGYYWEKSMLLKNRFILIKGLLLGTLLHMIFNYLIINYEPIVIPTTFLSVYGLFILFDFEKLKELNHN